MSISLSGPIIPFAFNTKIPLKAFNETEKK